jgi:hypothetical protein
MARDMMRRTDAWVFLLPPGWARFPVGDGRRAELAEAIEAVVARILPADLPRDSTEPLRRLTRERLRSGLTLGGDEGASVVYLPVQPIDGVFIPASITEIEFESDAGIDPLQVVAGILTDGYDESDILEIDGCPAIRITAMLRDVPGDAEVTTVSSRQVVYAISRDEDDGSWLALSFSVIFTTAESERLADALVLFFDAVMTTFRWAGGDPVDPYTDVERVPGSVGRP